jgi:large subunit ribosomal protein L21
MITEFERYAIFKTGGKQYQGIEGKTVAIEKLDGQLGDKVEFKEVLFRKQGSETYEIGQPLLPVTISASIVRQMRGPKVIAFTFRRRNKTRVKQGHRQAITVVRIDSIGA